MNIYIKGVKERLGGEILGKNHRDVLLGDFDHLAWLRFPVLNPFLSERNGFGIFWFEYGLEIPTFSLSSRLLTLSIPYFLTYIKPADWIAFIFSKHVLLEIYYTKRVMKGALEEQ